MDIDQAKEERAYLKKLIKGTYTKAARVYGHLAMWAYTVMTVSLIASPFLGWHYLGLAGALLVIGCILSLLGQTAKKDKFHDDLTELAMAERLRENEVALLDPTDLRLIMSAVDYESLNFDQRQAYTVVDLQASKAERNRDARLGKRRNLHRPSRGPLS